MESVSPLMNAAGLVKSPTEALQFMKPPVAAVLLGSYTWEERRGNPGQTYFSGLAGTLNSLGIPGPGAGEWNRWLPQLRDHARRVGKELWVSVAGFDPEETFRLAEICPGAGIDSLEVNLGCPNVVEGNSLKPIPTYDVELLDAALKALSHLELEEDQRLGLKLSPVFDIGLLADVAAAINGRSVVSFVTAINTVPNAAAIRPDGSSEIDAPGGLAGLGAAIKWIAQGTGQGAGDGREASRHRS